MMKVRATIYPIGDGKTNKVDRYLWAEQGRYYKTLVNAQRAIERNAKLMVSSPACGGKIITLVDIY
ncbi:MAG: hypothetical protein EBU90_30865 [Proteobacteria bacterium]|jgi:hypothetical protein|nr:hypothetical protein [Pseudomonadota bacterium]